MATVPHDRREMADLSIGPDGQQRDYIVLSDAERAKGFVRPVRRSYVHETCGGATTMGLEIAETYARQPDYYGSTFCVHCGAHFLIGIHGQFVWDEPFPWEGGLGRASKVGT